jgi:hypothetical protein
VLKRRSQARHPEAAGRALRALPPAAAVIGHLASRGPEARMARRVADNGVVIELPHRDSGLSKATGTEGDFADRGWHDCRVHAVSVRE